MTTEMPEVPQRLRISEYQQWVLTIHGTRYVYQIERAFFFYEVAVWTGTSARWPGLRGGQGLALAMWKRRKTAVRIITAALEIGVAAINAERKEAPSAEGASQG